MARRPRDARIETREARTRLSVRKEPYWRQVHKGLAVGYYRGVNGGAWYVRRTVDGRKLTQRIAKADDHADADDDGVLSYDQAVRRAMSEERNRPATPEGMYTVAEAVADYLEDLRARAGETAAEDAEGKLDIYVLAKRKRKRPAELSLVPALGARPVASLQREEIRRWHRAIAATKSDDVDVQRRRRATANRNLRSLKAVLNFAYEDGRVSDRSAWDQVQAFGKVDAPRVRFLTAVEARRLVNRTDAGFRPLVQAALLTGCRYGELRRLTASAFDADAETLSVQQTKNGKVRHVPLTAEGTAFFVERTADLKPRDLVFERAPGVPWKHADQVRPMRAASDAAKINPPVSFHVLRHTYASLLARAGVSLQVISKAIGHADSRMTEKHYAHLVPDHVAKAVRKHLPKFSTGKAKVAAFK